MGRFKEETGLRAEESEWMAEGEKWQRGAKVGRMG